MSRTPRATPRPAQLSLNPYFEPNRWLPSRPLRDQRLDLQKVRQHLESIAPEAAGLDLKVVTPDLHDPSDAIIQEAQRENASLIVVGLHHRSRVGKLFLGSTAQRILMEATCSVLAVRTE